jgi:CRISPR-associated protein Cas1
MGKPYYIFSNGRIRRNENTIRIEKKDGKKDIPVEEVEALHIFGEVDLNTKLLNFLAQHEISLHIYNYYGFYAGSYLPRERNISGELLVRQVKHYLDKQKRFYLAYSFVKGAIFHILRNLREYAGTEIFREKIAQELEAASRAQGINELMGCEGRARSIYYQAFNTILKTDKFNIERREKRPPTNPINALISFGNSLMYTTVLGEIYKTPLNPTISYLHEPRERRYSLCLDLAEIFKPLIVDPIIFKLINNHMLGLEEFEKDVNYCYLNENGRKKFIREYENKLKTTIKHRKLKRKVSYRSLIKIECYKLIKHLLGDEIYQPFKAWW